MLHPILFAVAFILIVSPVASAQSEREADLQKLYGKWKVVGGELKGEDSDDLKRIRMEFKEEKMALHVPKRVEFTYELDANSKPKVFRMTALEGNFEGKVGVGFYKYEKTQLHLWLPNKPNGDDPPKNLEDEKAESLAHMILEKMTEKELKDFEEEGKQDANDNDKKAIENK